ILTEQAGLNAAHLRSKHDAAMDYQAYLATNPAKAERWLTIDKQIALTPSQRQLIESFTREMKVLCVSGIWCGDCVAQGPMIQKIADANPRMIDLKWLDRDAHMDLSQRITINAGLRVPVWIVMAEAVGLVSMF